MRPGPQLLLLGLVLACILPVQAASRSLTERTIRQVGIQPDGPLAGVTETDLRKLVASSEGDPFAPESVRATIRQLYATGLFYDVQAAVEPVGENRMDVTFVLQRAWRVQEIEFDGDVPMSRQLLLSRLPLRPRTLYSRRAVDEAIEALIGVYREFGYYQPSIVPRLKTDDKRAGIKIRFEIAAGRRATIASLRFVSEPADVASTLPLEEVELRSGQPYSPRAVEAELEKIRSGLARRGYLRAEGYVADEAELDLGAGTVDLEVRIVARDRIAINFTGTPLDPELIDRMPLFTSTGPGAAFPPRSAEFLRQELQRDGYLLASVEIVEDSGAINPLEQLTFHVERGPKLTLREVAFEGNTALADETLREGLGLTPRGAFTGGRFTQEELDQDFRRIRRSYQRLGYLDAEVSAAYDVSGDDLKVIFQIGEGPQVRVGSLRLAGVQRFPEEEIRRRMQLGPDQPYSPVLLAEDRMSVMAYYEDRGYRNVEFLSSVERVSSERADVAIEIVENTRLEVAQTLVVGNLETRRSIIQDRVVLEPGQPLSQGASLRTEANLYDLAIFTRVRVRDIPMETDPARRFVLIEVEESKQYLIQYGIGYSSFEGPRGTFGFNNNNVLGAGRSLSLNLRAGARRQRGNISLTLPRPFALELPTVLSLSVDNDKRIDVDRDRLSNIRGRPFDSLRYIASIQSERTLSRRESLFYRYKFEEVELDIPEDLKDPLEFFRTEDVRLSSVSITYLNDSREPTFDPAGGFFVNGEAQLAPKFLGSEAQFFRILAQGQYYKGLAPGLVLATSLRLGAITPFGEDDKSAATSVPVGERFFAGGASTLRGLPQDLAGPLLRDDEGNPVTVNRGTEENPDLVAVAEGGNALIIANAELRYPLFGILVGALFYDVGNIYRSFADLSGVKLNHSVGLGIGLQTPVGPLRLDAAYNPSPPDAPGFGRWTLHFNLGHPF